MTGIDTGISIGEGSLGGGIGGGGAGAGIDVPDERDSEDGGSGGSVYDNDDTRRPLLEVLEEPPTDAPGSSRDMLMLVVLKRAVGELLKRVWCCTMKI